MKYPTLVTLSVIFFFSQNTYSLDIFEDESVYWNQGRNTYLKYDEQDSSITGSNDHPIKLKKDDIRYALESLQIWDQDKLELNESLPPVFSIKQVTILGQQLAKGLAKAKPDQDILFAVEKRKERLLGLKTSVYYTAGRAFYKDGKLNIIIGDYEKPRQEGYEKAYDPTEVGIVKYYFLHGSRNSQQKFDKQTVKVVGIENKLVKKRARNDWFIIDVKKSSETYLALKEERENPKTARDKQFEIEAAKMAKERREMRIEMARIRKEMKEGGSASSGSSVEQRLENLDKLRDKGLVTDDEYKSKREEILNDI